MVRKLNSTKPLRLYEQAFVLPAKRLVRYCPQLFSVCLLQPILYSEHRGNKDKFWTSHSLETPFIDTHALSRFVRIVEWHSLQCYYISWGWPQHSIRCSFYSCSPFGSFDYGTEKNIQMIVLRANVVSVPRSAWHRPGSSRWQGHLLAYGRRDTYIYSLTTRYPSYSFSCFFLRIDPIRDKYMFLYATLITVANKYNYIISLKLSHACCWQIAYFLKLWHSFLFQSKRLLNINRFMHVGDINGLVMHTQFH